MLFAGLGVTMAANEHNSHSGSQGPRCKTCTTLVPLCMPPPSLPHPCLPTLTLRRALGGRGASCKRADNAVYIVFKWDDITLGHMAWQPSVAENSSFP
ncbi:hypothetical protein QQF64_017212 [Cirrhinus molitorella]|uniref:Secreted protein n=1 Tax=Cirrhinus molitorella TaxID=172907 RepID=A0ABR3LLA1_9TELE